MIRIKGGPNANKIHVYHIGDDGTETELTNITSMEMNKVEPGSVLSVKLEFLDLDIDILAEDR